MGGGAHAAAGGSGGISGRVAASTGACSCIHSSDRKRDPNRFLQLASIERVTLAASDVSGVAAVCALYRPARQRGEPANEPDRHKRHADQQTTPDPGNAPMQSEREYKAGGDRYRIVSDHHD